MQASELRERAARYRQMAMKITDDRLLEALAFFCAQYTKRADALERRRQRADDKTFRTRANEIWKGRGSPACSDGEDWLEAEREIADQDQAEG
jgi:hypothetical protein